MEFITNRTQYQVDLVKRLNKKIRSGWYKLSPSEQALWYGEAAKGAYNCSDLNRVELAVAQIALFLGLTVTVKTDWALTDIPLESDMERYLANVVAIRDHYASLTDALDFPTLPDTMNGLTVEGANNIEKTLELIYNRVYVPPTPVCLFSEGVNNSEVGGEWEAVSRTWYGTNFVNSMYTAGEPTMSVVNDDLVMSLSNSEPKTIAFGCFQKKEIIDFTLYSRLKAVFSECSCSGNWDEQFVSGVCLVKSLDTEKSMLRENTATEDNSIANAYFPEWGNDIVIEIPLDTIVGQGYVAIGLNAYSLNGEEVTMTAKLKSMWLE